MPVPSLRVRSLGTAALRSDGDFVLYWMVAARRRWDNFALEHAAALAREHGKPLVVLEALRAGYPHASARLHRFVLDGMAENERDFAGTPVTYYPYVEPEPGAGQGLLEAFADHAVAVVSDDFPCFFLPRMQRAAAVRLAVRLEVVDGNGLLPLRAADRAFHRAFDFRRFLQRELPGHLRALPAADPLRRSRLPRLARLPARIATRWPRASPALLDPESTALARLPIDHAVGPVDRRGGARTARALAKRFVEEKLDTYAERRQHPDQDGGSALSPYLHFGHLSPHHVFSLIAEREEWSTEDVSTRARGQREGFWGMRPSSEAYLDQLLVWRELGYNCCAFRDDYDRYASLPEWARKTLERHARDPRPALYSLEELEAAHTADEIWNAAQRELVTTGTIHNYLRMLWGKRVLEWSPSPEEAHERLVHLNDKYALDGRDPNSYSGISWCFGRYDRAWGPERPVFGTVRFMSSDAARRKLRLREYLRRFGPEKAP